MPNRILVYVYVTSIQYIPA